MRKSQHLCSSQGREDKDDKMPHFRNRFDYLWDTGLLLCLLWHKIVALAECAGPAPVCPTTTTAALGLTEPRDQESSSYHLPIQTVIWFVGRAEIKWRCFPEASLAIA